MARKPSLTGFPEWLPAERLVEQHVLDTLRSVFELHGFASIETRAVEPVGQLLRKGEIDKEVYGISRLQDEKAAKDDANALALHFDLTVPFARYVVENAGHLHFPFRRYQMQKVWRGERPQDGRFREFTQADADIVGDGTLPFRYDVELALVIVEALTALDLGDFRLRLNNRKLSEGFYRGLGIEDTAAVLREIDKLEKIGADRVAELLRGHGLDEHQASQALALASISTADTSFVAKVRELGVEHELLEEGLEELRQVIEVAATSAPGRIIADLSIARGLDYYTGTVYETVLIGHEKLGSICSGGRYESLAGDGKRVFPGVGLSFGVSRLVSRLLAEGVMTPTREVPSAVLVALPHDDDWVRAQDVARVLRGRGIATEVMATAEKFGKQIKHADRRGIPFVWFLGAAGADGENGAADTPGATDQVKDIRTGEQVDADAETWVPPVEDLRPAVVARDAASQE